MYAINIADLTGHKQHSPQHVALLLVLQQHINLDAEPIECERGKAVGMGHAAPFTCSDEQVEALVKLIRTRLKKYELRIYSDASGSWKRV
jgi:hypothetical protein